MDIRVIVNYFGKPPQVFQLWLDSCGANRLLKWIFFTDINMSRYHVPNNMQIVPCDFAWMRQRIYESFEYPVKYDSPYDFCSFRPLLGTIFQSELTGADFWGWSDLDMLYGDLSPVVAMAENGYDKVMPGGHFSITKNTLELNRFIYNHPCSRTALSPNEGLPCYDEVDFPLTVMRDYGAKQERDVIPFVHLNPRCGHFLLDGCDATTRILGLGNREPCPLVLTWCDGHLKGYFALPNRTVRSLELVYVHFFKRDIKEKIGRLTNDGTEYLILPEGVVKSADRKIYHRRDYWGIRLLDYPRIHWQYFLKRMNWNTFKRKIHGIRMRLFK